MQISYFYGTTRILLVVASISVYVIVGTATAISGISLAFSFSNESPIAQRLDRLKTKASQMRYGHQNPVPCSRPHDVAPPEDGTICRD